tara:strand:+ start:5326 stop:5685 length:360 start_codon:yes stop_codon:yes gene_type:complete
MFKNRLQQIIAERKTVRQSSEPSEEVAVGTPEEETKRTRGENRKDDKTERQKDRGEKVKERREYRLEKINALKEKFYAVASKRKWLFFVIAGAIVAYLVIFKGGFGGIDILTKIKGFFG